MTRKQLKKLGLSPEQLEQVISLHGETVEPLRREAEGLREEAAALRAQQEDAAATAEQLAAMTRERDACQARLQRMEAQQLQNACAALLRESGANTEAIPLLLRAIDVSAVRLDADGALQSPEEVLAPLKAQYGSFFVREHVVGLPDVNPPVYDSPLLTREEVSAMDAEEINRHWDSVRAALR